MNERKFVLEADGEAFNKEAQANNISDTTVVYSKKVADATKIASQLDRYDDFANLKIPEESYERSAQTGIYGIQRNQYVHGNGSVILRHQSEAAKSFLRELRGFGLLADIVGSGKTYEACLVLSELATRGKVKSVLFIVPNVSKQAWKRVAELEFGMGKGNLKEVVEFDDIQRMKGDNIRPAHPIIVSVEDFAKWDTTQVSDILFDAVIVDEAHRLCNEKDNNARAMMLLSTLMEVKKKYNSTYCILLSATPHDGNLEQMFKLWYFIRCKGGNPKDFEPKEESQRTASYRRERAYYTNVVCRGATTVAEFIAVSKKYELEGIVGEGDGMQLHVSRFKDNYYKFLQSKLGGDYEKKYKMLPEGQKRVWRDEYLAQERAKPDSTVAQDVITNIARAYHNGVMRSIMIRQPRSSNKPKKRSVENIYFFPVDKIPANAMLKYDNVKFEVDYNHLFDSKGITFTNAQGQQDHRAFPHFVRYFSNANTYHAIYAELLLSTILGSIGSFNDSNLFGKANSLRYYWEQFAATTNSEITNTVKLMPSNADVFDQKYEVFAKIATENANNKILVFFDYNLTQQDVNYGQWKKLYETIKQKNPELLDRVIYATSNNGEDVLSDEQGKYYVNKFNDTDAAILIVGVTSMTESLNLQESNIAINFQVTPDPQAMDQRIGRVHRLGQKQDVRIISLACMNQLEGYALAYLSRIGIMHSTSNDASIIAGSNDSMVAIRCPACGKVELISSVEYNERKHNNKLICTFSEICTRDGKGTVMQEINIHQFQCDKCGVQFNRGSGEEGYRCFATNNTNRSKLVNNGGNDYYCSKICSMKNCNRFATTLKGKCAILNMYQDKPISVSQCKVICYQCKYYGNLCPAKCSMMFDNSLDSIKGCIGCDQSQCNPPPHIISFDDNWTAQCPKCKTGVLRQKKARTFEDYIRASYSFVVDGGRGFCDNLGKEARKTDDIRLVLENDDNK